MSQNVASLVNGEGDDTMEIWNLVFMQYDRSAEGTLTPLPAPSVDTGMGLERLSSVLQKASTVYDIDSFQTVMAAIAKGSGRNYGGDMDDELDTAMRVLWHHAPSSAPPSAAPRASVATPRSASPSISSPNWPRRRASPSTAKASRS